MGSTADKIKGNTNEAVGKAKQGIGEATGSDRLQGEGAVQEIKGKGQKALGDAKEATKDAVNKAADAANRAPIPNRDRLTNRKRPVCTDRPFSLFVAKSALHAEQFDFEDQRGIRRNDAAGAAGAIAECRRNNQRALAADFHGGDAFVPAGNDLMLADRK